MNERTQADVYVQRVATQQHARPHPAAKIERADLDGNKVSFYTFPDGSRARVDRGNHGPSIDAQVI